MFNVFWSNYKTNGVNQAGVLGTQRTKTKKYMYYKLFSYMCMILFPNPKKLIIFYIRYRYIITNSLELTDAFNQMIASNESY